MNQIELLPEATAMERNRADLKARIDRHTRQVFRRVRDTSKTTGQLALGLLHTVGKITGRVVELIRFCYQGVGYQILKAPDDHRAPLTAIQEVLGFEVPFHKIYFVGAFRETI